mmetsp:Transcript_33383/g.30353  ORF Transcript_33383/g.30353 Transcript_33383/m.30353 type:complete len:130 (+) Transcript_33383:285-674(+)|eukprot:CAMPEP_0114588958 /NCGR_PEP_ID=MMETSP0125-20121206/11542_1 /TAXON_ID=485358 ORGANISM="Aristerostoma sp., Strain ATCC 50986" /NCGR_SAMPLE_ID=MMETSP0125 /ASSEMBLY_ACC=CAM_ASM_000245 /LENGTH=129 /DNA_ID=CAMNT_0001785637 /DNA_START=285 /DNA_END=674 /DNA_ORIENTATION=+
MSFYNFPQKEEQRNIDVDNYFSNENQSEQPHSSQIDDDDGEAKSTIFSKNNSPFSHNSRPNVEDSNLNIDKKSQKNEEIENEIQNAKTKAKADQKSKLKKKKKVSSKDKKVDSNQTSPSDSHKQATELL